MASALDPGTGGSTKASVGAGVTVGAAISAGALLLQDPYKTVILGIAGIVSPLVTAGFPVVRRRASNYFRLRRTRDRIKKLRELIAESQGANSPDEHIASLRERLQRAESYLADFYVGEVVPEEEDQATPKTPAAT